MTRRRFVLVLVALAVAVAAVVVFTSPSTKAKKASADPTTTEVNTTVRSAEECTDGHNVALDENEGKKLISEGVGGIPSDEVRDKVIMVAAHDTRVLQVYYNATPLGKQNPVELDELAEDGCYTQVGRDTFTSMKTQYEMASIEPATVPADGMNTGANPGGAAFQVTTEVITGDRSGHRVTFKGPDGAVLGEVFILNRCGNLVTEEEIPGIPPETTTSTTTIPTTTTVPTTTTTEGGKDDADNHLNNPAVPDQERGCAGTGSTPAGTAPCPGDTGGTADPQCTNTDGSHTLESDGYCDNTRPTTTTSSPSSTTTTSTSSTTTSTTAPPSDRTGSNESPPTTENRPRENATTTTQPGQTSPSTTSPPTTTPPPPQ